MTRGERRARTEAVVQHCLREWRQIGRGVPDGWVRGTLRKGHHWFACGKTRCMTCHAEKLLDKPKPRDLRQLASALD